MPNGRYIALALCAWLIAITAVYFAYIREPSYKGRSLSSWVLQIDATKPPTDPKTEEAKDAIRHMGKSAIPHLLRWMRYEELPGWADKASSREKEDRDERNSLSFGAAETFAALGPEAVAAKPQLLRLITESKSQIPAWRAMYALSKLGHDGLPPLIALLTNQSFEFRGECTYVLRSLGTNARPALPALVESLKDPDRTVAMKAADALGNLKLDPETVIPALEISLRDPRWGVNMSAVRALGKFRGQATRAVPLVLDLLTNSDTMVRIAATNALLKIAPETLTNTPPRWPRSGASAERRRSPASDLGTQPLCYLGFLL